MSSDEKNSLTPKQIVEELKKMDLEINRKFMELGKNLDEKFNDIEKQLKERKDIDGTKLKEMIDDIEKRIYPLFNH